MLLKWRLFSSFWSVKCSLVAAWISEGKWSFQGTNLNTNIVQYIFNSYTSFQYISQKAGSTGFFSKSTEDTDRLNAVWCYPWGNTLMKTHSLQGQYKTFPGCFNQFFMSKIFVSKKWPWANMIPRECVPEAAFSAARHCDLLAVDWNQDQTAGIQICLETQFTQEHV